MQQVIHMIQKIYTITVIDTAYVNRRFYIILTGSINVIRIGRGGTLEDGKTVFQLGRGESFGEHNIHNILKE
jgi:CRP-like cAMP-binding protein